MVQEDRVGREGTREASDLRADVEALKSDIGALRRDVTSLVQDVLTAGKVQAGEAGQPFLNAARSRLENYGVDTESLSAHGQQLLESVQEQIERRPLMSIGIALGLGMVLGSIFRRR